MLKGGLTQKGKLPSRFSVIANPNLAAVSGSEAEPTFDDMHEQDLRCSVVFGKDLFCNNRFRKLLARGLGNSKAKRHRESASREEHSAREEFGT